MCFLSLSPGSLRELLDRFPGSGPIQRQVRACHSSSLLSSDLISLLSVLTLSRCQPDSLTVLQTYQTGFRLRVPAQAVPSAWNAGPHVSSCCLSSIYQVTCSLRPFWSFCLKWHLSQSSLAPFLSNLIQILFICVVFFP